MADKKYSAILFLKDKVSKTLANIQKNTLRTNRDLGKFQERLDKLGKHTANIQKLGKSFQDVGNKMTVGLTLPIVAVGGAMVKSAADMEAAQMQLSTLLGSEKEGAEMFNEIKTMAAKTPFGTKDLMQASNTMLGFGINQKKVLPYMKQLGDISGGNAERFQSLALAFSQVSAAGKLQGQDLSQMINAGFNPLEAISKRTGKSIGQLKEEMGKGAITVDMVTQAMEDATSKGGRFYQMMEKQSQTGLGKFSTLMDDLNMALADFGNILLPHVIKLLEKTSQAIQWFNNLSPTAKKAIIIFGGILALVGPLTTGIGGLITMIHTANMAIGVLLANPIILTIVGIAAAFWGVCKAVAKLIELLNKLKLEKIKTIKTDFDDSQMKKLSKIQAGMGDKAFIAKYVKDVSNQVTSYRQSQIKNETNNSAINNHFYGNINSTGSMMLDDIIFSGGNMPAYNY